ncbi:hypothetical protein AG1IA_04481 [Rhizoctonia solani AG-1 IA]|uniref:Uncharacterized protein n=1 Tax=Thanatephorus cucumeris (strain AG1-IA) TaxID=983506 RepID=L8WYP9_THACA|nr:hypothetical protein AG1IA_04481 [Rhizoctonia solani AG-1 IA]
MLKSVKSIDGERRKPACDAQTEQNRTERGLMHSPSIGPLYQRGEKSEMMPEKSRTRCRRRSVQANLSLAFQISTIHVTLMHGSHEFQGLLNTASLGPSSPTDLPARSHAHACPSSLLPFFDSTTHLPPHLGYQKSCQSRNAVKPILILNLPPCTTLHVLCYVATHSDSPLSPKLIPWTAARRKLPPPFRDKFQLLDSRLYLADLSHPSANYCDMQHPQHQAIISQITDRF